MATIWCNGEWLDSDDGGVSLSDRGLLHGLGLFETILAVNGGWRLAHDHLGRLKKGMSRLGWDMPDHDPLPAMNELLERNALTEGFARIRLAVTGGSGALDDLTPGKDQKMWMTASPIAKGKSSLSLGLSLWRRNEHSPLVGLKCASYAENLMALNWAKSAGFDEVLFVNTAGNLCEAATANLFLVKDGNLLTPSLESGCLPGVTRQLIIELATKMEMPMNLEVYEESLSLTDLKQAHEIFLTSATRGVMPVTRFEDTEWSVGPVTGQLARMWKTLVTGP